MLEEHGLTKGNFKSAEDLINDGRKTGQLPINFTAMDGARSFSSVQFVDSSTPAEEAAWIIRNTKDAYQRYHPHSFWDYQKYYVELMVEKIDLKSLFQDQCAKYHIPIANARGWSDINMRNESIQRFKAAELRGAIPVLLYCGDFDPAGISISDTLRKNFNDLEQATGWRADNLIVDRFGLNYDFILQHNLSMVDNLETGSGKDLASPSHPDHFKPWVQDYIKAYGVRKCEANTLITRIEAGRKLLDDTLDKYINHEAVEQYRVDTAIEQQKVAELVNELIGKVA